MRTEQATPVKSKFNGQWACTFKVFQSHKDTEFLSGELETAAVWFDEAAARKAGARAMEILEQTGKWPNMCEVW